MSPGQYDIPMDLCVKTRRKLRLEEFLRQNLDHAPAGHVIQWVNRNEGVFRILWTHQSSGAFTHDDAALFRYWALARGKPANLSSVELKQSLRMALNKSPSVQRVAASQDEFRYFRFTDWQSEGFSSHALQNEKFRSPYSNSASMTPIPQVVYPNSDGDIYQRGLSFTDYFSAMSRCSSSSSVSSVESYASHSNSPHSHEANYRLQILADHGSTLQDHSHQNQNSFLESTRGDSNTCLCEQQRGLPYSYI
ncbi:uncharacterized protein LOC135207259 [Macrobrachium nipponense]|uniref:uncharacterized protein LOC135207259 n=1 Tax=Macrobrachium nipponense TaxID=159736 RepID=UPI0030C7B42E